MINSFLKGLTDPELACMYVALCSYFEIANDKVRFQPRHTGQEHRVRANPPDDIGPLLTLGRAADEEIDARGRFRIAPLLPKEMQWRFRDHLVEHRVAAPDADYEPLL